MFKKGSSFVVATMLCFISFYSASAFSDAAVSQSVEESVIVASWVQYTVDGAEVRAVTTGRCGNVELDGRLVLMKVRAPATKDFPSTVCYAVIPDKTKNIQLADTLLPLPQYLEPRKVVVMGDGGCRVSKKHGLFQACNNSSVWPLKSIATSAANYKPDLIIYTGDYIYRESPCPEGNKGCAGSPYGKNQATWEADWFTPSQAIRSAAPFAFVRGNHESCKRAGSGWFRYLDARPYTDKCVDITAPWVLKLATFELAMLDTSSIKGNSKAPLVDHFVKQLTEVNKLITKSAWLATHRPFWGYGADDDSGELVMFTDVLQNAVKQNGMPDKVDLLIGAHIHLAQVLSFDSQRPPQLIVGNGGSELVARTASLSEIDGETILSQQTLYQYGFVTMEPDVNGWKIDFKDVEGRLIKPCLYSERFVECI